MPYLPDKSLFFKKYVIYVHASWLNWHSDVKKLPSSLDDKEDREVIIILINLIETDENFMKLTTAPILSQERSGSPLEKKENFTSVRKLFISCTIFIIIIFSLDQLMCVSPFKCPY